MESVFSRVIHTGFLATLRYFVYWIHILCCDTQEDLTYTMVASSMHEAANFESRLKYTPNITITRIKQLNIFRFHFNSILILEVN